MKKYKAINLENVSPSRAGEALPAQAGAGLPPAWQLLPFEPRPLLRPVPAATCLLHRQFFFFLKLFSVTEIFLPKLDCNYSLPYFGAKVGTKWNYVCCQIYWENRIEYITSISLNKLYSYKYTRVYVYILSLRFYLYLLTKFSHIHIYSAILYTHIYIIHRFFKL